MALPHIPYLACPICATSFIPTDRALTCINAHSFDIARKGYVNFLLKKAAGDTREMLLARQTVFAQGHFLPLSDAVNEIISAHLADNDFSQPGSARACHPERSEASDSPPTEILRCTQDDIPGFSREHSSSRQQDRTPLVVLDAGCGEGYYLSRLQTELATRHVQAICLGLDVSKEAVRLATARCRAAFFVVADLKERLPTIENSVHVLLNIFAPRNPPEFARVMAPGGLLLVVIPAPTHLLQLRTALHLLQIEEQKQRHVIAQFTAQDIFRLETSTTVSYELYLQGDAIRQLVTMTPNYWHLTEEMSQAIAQLSEIRTKVACECLAFRRQEQV